MSKKLMMNNYSENDVIVLCKDFSPNGQPFVLWENQMIDWDKYELYININLEHCVKLANILSIGVDIAKWNGYAIHTYLQSNNSIEFSYVPLNTGMYRVYSHLVNINDDVQLIFNKNSIYINSSKLNVDTNNNFYKDVLTKIFSSTITIGSQEGAVRSNATYNLVQLQPYQERG